MPTLRMGKAFIYEDGGADFLARVIAPNGNSASSGNTNTITYAVFDLDCDNIANPVSSGSLALTVLSGLKTDSRWTVDSTGYNFKDSRTPSDFPAGGHTYRVEYLFTPVSGQPFFVCFEVTTVRVYTS